MRDLTIVAWAAAVAAALSGCAPMTGSKGPVAVATLAPTQGNSAAGTVSFEPDGDGVRVHAKLTGLKPNGEHGFHVHERGDCSAPDATSAGGHYNPGGQPHGPQTAPHHAGDMPSLKADASGAADATFTIKGVAIGSGADIIGRAVVVHAQPDDYTTQPTGNSGARIACGVIARHP
jgi:Cu-Zn family superoxide dismutase